ncbi:hypothetical protein, partial [Geobacillus stearothermophilus]|uniref:hypothetical protein n=1 Tax=Geobacillus stearothermophilus TaxID=1422 RepID=UPI001C7D0FDB
MDVLEASSPRRLPVVNDPHLNHSHCCSICNILLDKTGIYTRNIKADNGFFTIFLRFVTEGKWETTMYREEKRSIPVRSFSGDLIKKSPLGMMQGCQTIPTIMPRRTSDELY